MEYKSVPPEDQLPLSFTPDQQEDIQGLVKEVHQHLQMINFYFSNSGVSRFVADSVLKLVESNISKLGKAMGVETQSEKNIEERHGDMRRANTRIRELESLLGQGQPPEGIQPALKALCRQINDWWGLEGFGHISELAFGEYGLKVDFCCQFIGVEPHVVTPTPVSRKERMALWQESLKERGFVLAQDDEDRDKGIRDCDQSRNTLRQLFAQRLSSARISKFEGRESRGESQLTSVEVYISDITQILSLPVPPSEAENSTDQ
jgi:hypothetical protein